jgi:hypothetical protein
MSDDFDTLLLKDLFEHGSLARPEEEKVKDPAKAKPRLRQQIAGFFGLKHAGA